MAYLGREALGALPCNPVFEIRIFSLTCFSNKTKARLAGEAESKLDGVL